MSFIVSVIREMFRSNSASGNNLWFYLILGGVSTVAMVAGFMGAFGPETLSSAMFFLLVFPTISKVAFDAADAVKAVRVKARG